MGCLAKFMLYAFLHLTEFRVILGSRIVKKHIMYFPYVCNSFMHLVGYLKASGICWTFHIHPNTKEKHFFVQFGAPSYSLERWCHQNWAPCFFFLFRLKFVFRPKKYLWYLRNNNALSQKISFFRFALRGSKKDGDTLHISFAWGLQSNMLHKVDEK